MRDTAVAAANQACAIAWGPGYSRMPAGSRSTTLGPVRREAAPAAGFRPRQFKGTSQSWSVVGGLGLCPSRTAHRRRRARVLGGDSLGNWVAGLASACRWV